MRDRKITTDKGGERDSGAGKGPGKGTSERWSGTEDYDKQGVENRMGYGLRIQKRSMATTHH